MSVMYVLICINKMCIAAVSTDYRKIAFLVRQKELKRNFAFRFLLNFIEIKRVMSK